MKYIANWYDVVELCDELGVVKRIKDESDEDYELRVAEEICLDEHSFMCKYTSALLGAIQMGYSKLTGKTEWYKGFGKRIDKRSIRMILKTETEKPGFAP